jgi:adenylate kinase
LGAPGSGKGTPLGVRAKASMDAGKLVDDDTVLGMIRERLAQPDARQGFILDGFPRNIAQAEALASLLGELGQPLDAVVLLDVDMSILFKRLTGRRICQDCGRVFNIYTTPALALAHCEACGHAPRLVQRPDDKEEVIGKRLEVFEAQTKPLIQYYENAGLLRVIEADADVGTVFESLRAVIDRAVVSAAPA